MPCPGVISGVGKGIIGTSSPPFSRMRANTDMIAMLSLVDGPAAEDHGFEDMFDPRCLFLLVLTTFTSLRSRLTPISTSTPVP